MTGWWCNFYGLRSQPPSKLQGVSESEKFNQIYHQIFFSDTPSLTNKKEIFNMKHGENLVKKERSGKALSFAGKTVDEYTEQYDPVREGLKALEEIEQGKEFTPDRISKIRQVRLILWDMTPSEDRDKEKKRFDNIIKEHDRIKHHRNKSPSISLPPKKGCPVGTKYNPKTKKCEKNHKN